ncbi:hypothetical protein V5N11_007355 [Cardamine amara subsp. amara]|uniref:Palmitoyl-protein thioesterase 1 n=1 Tax=Cardamine amara subsp. amara TaxID=228776 RepID=A0ABD1B4T6_CARAN
MIQKGLKRYVIAVAVVIFLAMVDASVSLPFIVLHGLSCDCSSGSGDANFTDLLTRLSDSPGSCLEIGNGKDDSWSMPLTKQVEIACEKVKKMEELGQGYNIVGRSQGNLVARGLIEFCDDGPPVHNYISLAGPHAGIASVPYCDLIVDVCSEINDIIKKYLNIYSDYVQDHVAPAGYIKNLEDIKNYLHGSKYLPKLNNEKPDQRNSTYKDRFTSLQNLVLVMFELDVVIVPKESSWFGFDSDGDSNQSLPVQQTKLYTEDWIGLKTLDDAGKVKFVTVPGEHIRMAEPDIIKYVVPYLKDQPSSVQIINRKTMELLHP